MFIPDYNDEFIKDEVALVDGYWEGSVFINQHSVPYDLFRKDLSESRIAEAKYNLSRYNLSADPALQITVPVHLLNEEARDAVRQSLLSKGGEDLLFGKVTVSGTELYYGASFGIQIADEPAVFCELSPKTRNQILEAVLNDWASSGEFFDEPHAYERRIRFYDYDPDGPCSGEFIVHLPGDYIRGEFSMMKYDEAPVVDLESIRRNAVPDYDLDDFERAVINELVHNVIDDMREHSRDNTKTTNRTRGM